MVTPITSIETFSCCCDPISINDHDQENYCKNSNTGYVVLLNAANITHIDENLELTIGAANAFRRFCFSARTQMS